MWQWINTYQSYDTIAKISQHIPIISTCVFILSMVAYIPVVVGLISLFLLAAIIIGCIPIISKSSPFMLVNQWCVLISLSYPQMVHHHLHHITIWLLFIAYIPKFSHHVPIISPHWTGSQQLWPCDEITPATKVIHSICVYHLIELSSARYTWI